MIIKNEELMFRLEINTNDPVKVLKALIQAKGISKRQLCNLANISQIAFYSVLNKQTQITKNMSEKLAKVLNIKPHLLYKLRLEKDIEKIKKEISKLDT